MIPNFPIPVQHLTHTVLESPERNRIYRKCVTDQHVAAYAPGGGGKAQI